MAIHFWRGPQGRRRSRGPCDRLCARASRDPEHRDRDPRTPAQAGRGGPSQGRAAKAERRRRPRPRRRRAAAAEAAPSEAASRIPAHLLERSRAAKAAPAASGRWRRRRRRERGGGGSRWPTAHRLVTAAPADGGVPVGAGPGGHTQRLLTVVQVRAPSRTCGPRRSTRCTPGPTCWRPSSWPPCRAPRSSRVLDLRERTAAAARQPQPDARTRPRRRGTSSACRSCSRCSTRWSPA